MTQTIVPDAELLIATGCVHCPAVLAALSELLKQGRLGRLSVVNIAQHPEIAATYGVRGVPWMRIGPFELSGAHSQAELSAWVERAGSPAGRQAYLTESLETGQLDSVTAACRRSPELLPELIALAGDLDTPFAVRIGVGAVLEDLGPEGLLNDQIAALRQLADSGHPQVRADAAHFLGLLQHADALPVLRRLLSDNDAEVREIAAESLAGIGEH